ncbi:hypothetical protein BGZ73_000847 [Actinomortierella ambigua]|nr:hypothetical protein BGZ73_000847 [Actinomortierella ambigua]
MLFNFLRVASAVVLLSSSTLLVSAAPSLDNLLAEDTTLSHLEKRAAASIVTACKNPGQVAVTFDDGPSAYTPALLDYLDKKKVKVTFFVNGDNAGRIDKGVKKAAVVRAYKAGHQIASHTWSHQDLAKLSTSKIGQEMKKLDDTLKKLIGVRPLYMRPPYGSTNSKALKYLGDNGYTVVNWNIDSNDWQHPDDVASSIKAYTSVLTKSSARKQGWIALQHDTYAKTATELGPQIIDWLLANKYTVVPVGTCLGKSQKQWYRK